MYGLILYSKHSEYYPNNTSVTANFNEMKKKSLDYWGMTNNVEIIKKINKLFANHTISTSSDSTFSDSTFSDSKSFDPVMMLQSRLQTIHRDLQKHSDYNFALNQLLSPLTIEKSIKKMQGKSIETNLKDLTQLFDGKIEGYKQFCKEKEKEKKKEKVHDEGSDSSETETASCFEEGGDEEENEDSVTVAIPPPPALLPSSHQPSIVLPPTTDRDRERTRAANARINVDELDPYVRRDISKRIDHNQPITKNIVDFYHFLDKHAIDPLHFFATKSSSAQADIIETVHKINDKQLNEPIILRILQSNIPEDVKGEVYEKYITQSKDEDGKLKTWLHYLLKIPFGVYAPSPIPTIASSTIDTKEFLTSSLHIMDEAVFGHENAKHKLLQYIGQYINNQDSRGFVLGLKGPMGNGKTTLVEKAISKIFNRPFIPIPLGGATDASFLNGHSFTYVGSIPGQILESIMKAKVMNPIFYFDELDKISKTTKGDEITNLLIHLTDPSQNFHFQDRYFGNINFNLSKAIFIFSYNDESKINPILLDRIHQIETSGFTTMEKIQIAQQHLLPTILKEVGLDKYVFNSHGRLCLNISETILRNLIEQYTNELGVRRFKELLDDILRDINLEILNETIVIPSSSPPCLPVINVSTTNKRRKKNNGEAEKIVAQQPIPVNPINLFAQDWEYIQEHYLKSRLPIIIQKCHEYPQIGKINGMYATESRNGGLIPIYASWTYSEKAYEILLTGNLQKVMRESARVAQSIAWNILEDGLKTKWHAYWKKNKMGVHIHCLRNSVPKEGPSAGVALTLAMYSLLTNTPIRHNIAITGEIDLTGNVHAIGGLRDKLFGAKRAGCEYVLFPTENNNDYERIKHECGDELFGENGDELKIYQISNIYEAIQYTFLTENKEGFDFDKIFIMEQEQDGE